MVARDSFKLSFKLFQHTIILRVKASLITIEIDTYQSHFSYSDESSISLVRHYCLAVVSARAGACFLLGSSNMNLHSFFGIFYFVD
jgi:hypothetical protein